MISNKFLTACCYILASIHAMGASLHLDVSPSNISPGLSSSLNITCTFSYQSSSNVSYILSLILAKDDERSEEAKRYLELASLNVFDGDRVTQLTQIQASASGHTGEQDDSYLSLQWTNPSQLESGVYRCEARGMDKTGHCLSFSQTAQVSTTQPHVDDLTVMVGQLQMNLQQYTESSSLLIAALERMEESQNVTLSSLQFDVRQLQDQHKSLETAVTSQISQWQSQCQVLTDLHKSYLPRTCKDVVSDEPREVVVLSDGLEVLCDTETDGGGWLVIQRRFSGEEDFYRNWEDYKYGFGDINGEFWFGNEKTHRLTTQRQYELRVDFTYNSTNYYAEYSRIIVYGEPEKYKLKLGSYSGNAGDTLSIRGHNMAFTTKDRDNDIDSSVNCAQRFTGAWWYANCHLANLNGLWGSKDYGKGLNWVNTTGAYDSATFTEMKIRPIALN